jgi:hypothetical protein
MILYIYYNSFIMLCVTGNICPVYIYAIFLSFNIEI